MKDYIGHLLMVLGVAACVAGLGIYRRSQTPRPEPEKKKGVEESPLESRTVSKPGAALEVKAVPIPPKIQSKMAEAIRKEYR